MAPESTAGSLCQEPISTQGADWQGAARRMGFEIAYQMDKRVCAKRCRLYLRQARRRVSKPGGRKAVITWTGAWCCRKSPGDSPVSLRNTRAKAAASS